MGRISFSFGAGLRYNKNPSASAQTKRRGEAGPGRVYLAVDTHRPPFTFFFDSGAQGEAALESCTGGSPHSEGSLGSRQTISIKRSLFRCFVRHGEAFSAQRTPARKPTQSRRGGSQCPGHHTSDRTAPRACARQG